MSPTLLDLAHRYITGWLAHREARRRHERWSRLCRVVPKIATAYEGRAKAKKSHRPTRHFDAAIQQAMSERLRREIGA